MLCSNCFDDHGLKLESLNVGYKDNKKCPNCGSVEGYKLDEKSIMELTQKFFIQGSFNFCIYGGASVLNYHNNDDSNDNHKGCSVVFPQNLARDVKLIENSIGIKIFFNAPPTWRVGENEYLQKLLDPSERNSVIKKIIGRYPEHIIDSNTFLYRLRKNPKNPKFPEEYDSPPLSNLPTSKHFRFDSDNLSVMYASQDLQICLHESRIAAKDEMYFATLIPKKRLRLLNLDADIINDTCTEFESLSTAMNMLLQAGEHSRRILGLRDNNNTDMNGDEDPYHITQAVAMSAFRMHYDGIMYPSYFSGYRLDKPSYITFKDIRLDNTIPAIENIALFGHPIKDRLVSVECINKLTLKSIDYNFTLGPVL